MAESKFSFDSKTRRVILVKSCQKFHDRQDACRATWAGELAKHVPLWFVEAGYPQNRITDCWILLSGGDAYMDNSIKVRDAISLLLEYDPFDLLFICDDDTFIQWRRWLEFWPSTEFCGLKTKDIPWVHGGGGWWMSRRACEAFVRGINRRCSWDDRLASEILDPLGFKFENRPDLFAQWDERVSAGNNLITCHKVGPAEMLNLFQSTYDLAPLHNVLS